MRQNKNTFVQILLKVTPEMNTRIRYHSKVLARGMNDIIREATGLYLDTLDEKELARIENKRRRQSKGAYVPQPVEHKWGKPPGLGKKTGLASRNNTPPMSTPSFTTAVPTEPIAVPKKIERSFRRFAEYLEAAEDKVDAATRAKTISEDIQERTTSSAEADACVQAFKEFMEARRDSQTKPTIDVGETPLSGDIE